VNSSLKKKNLIVIFTHPQVLRLCTFKMHIEKKVQMQYVICKLTFSKTKMLFF